MDKFNYFYGCLSGQELLRISKLLEKVFKRRFDYKYLNWLYNQNPNGKAISFNIANNIGEIIGHYVIIPVFLLVNGKKYKSGLSLNTAVDPKFRGKGFFKLMAQKTYDKAKDHDLKFIISVANNQSTKLFLKYFNFQNLGSLDVKIGIGEIQKDKQNINLQFFWDSNSINWRLKNPKYIYNFKKNENEINVYLKKFSILNILLGSFKLNYFPKLITKNETQNNLKMFIGLGKYNWKNSYYLNLPDYFKPSPLNLILKNITNDKIIQVKKNDVFVQLIDFDAF
tara:strand:+ start:1017 stop:1862 length:846 start_codon:yes stop_codon:yes gene_type:complete